LKDTVLDGWIYLKKPAQEKKKKKNHLKKKKIPKVLISNFGELCYPKAGMLKGFSFWIKLIKNQPFDKQKSRHLNLGTYVS
jgi:hypothetical protein